MDQVLPEDETINSIEFSLLREWQNQLLMQGFDSSNRTLIKILEFCERLEKAEEIFQDKGYGSHPNKNPSSPVIDTNKPRFDKIPINPHKIMEKSNIKIKIISLHVPCMTLDTI